MPTKPIKNKAKKSPVKKKKISLFRQILAEREKSKEHSPPQPYRSDHRGHHPPQQQRHEQFAKFAGPRRRAA